MTLSRATTTQQQASAPDTSVWVSASAGSGKTKVLTDRILTLLLKDAQPERILCLTFTKAAAAEMENRLFERLGSWVILSQDQLVHELQILMDRDPTADEIHLSRHLFAQVLDTPGGLKIQTIHAFCQSVLKRFPLEARLSPHFRVIDEKKALELMHQTQGDLLQNHELQDTLQHLGQLLSPQKFRQLNKSIVDQRKRFSHVTYKQRLERELQIDFGTTPKQLVKNFHVETDHNNLWKAAKTLRLGSPTDQQHGENIVAWLESEGDENAFKRYLSCFLTTRGEPRQKFLTNRLNLKHPDVLDLLQSECERILPLLDQLKAYEVAQNSYHISFYAHALLKGYEDKKTDIAALDYQDLILKTAHLLNDANASSWVLYKLDGGLDHILIDEAQDTSPDQWQVIAALCEEFFSHTDDERTLFVVGDDKQSIYSFQGADPARFTQMHDHFKQTSQSIHKNWKSLQLDVSFRSTPQVLEAVDAIFQNEQARSGVSSEQIKHYPFRTQDTGHVEVWPLVEPEEEEDIAPWSLPRIEDALEAPRTRLARLMAKTIQKWLQEKRPVKGRPLSPGDILILVRKRSLFVDEMIRYLKEYNIPVAGIDRMIIGEQLAVQDLLKLAEFTCFPHDELTLATVLKGPLFNLTEEQLFDLAYPRGTKNLWASLQEYTVWEEVVRTLKGLITKAGHSTPYAFFAHILGPLQGRRLWQSRLGEEALDPLDELLNLALDFEKEHTPTLQLFLQWFEQDDTELKRDLDQSDEVRIMTVHGSKGLQAPVVFLPDTVQTPREMPEMLWHGDICLWTPPGESDTPLTQNLKQQHAALQQAEYRRLLYVALTRAEDHLYICGWQQNQKELDPNCWYSLIHSGLFGTARHVDFDFSTLLGKEGWKGAGFLLSSDEKLPSRAEETKEEPVQQRDLPSWLHTPLGPDPLPTQPLTPSKLGGETHLRALVPDPQGLGLKRGRCVHKILEILPQLPPDQWEEGCRHYLKHQAFPEPEKEKITHNILTILGEYPELFTQNSQAEVPVIGLVGNFSLSGQIDRLIVTEKCVHIVDYKTNVTPPLRIEETPIPYLRQLAAYQEALAQIYQNYEIQCSLLWTSLPRLDTIPEILLNQYELFPCSQEHAA